MKTSQGRCKESIVHVREVVGSGIFVASGDGERVSQAIVSAISQGQEVRLSFKGCEVLTAAFLSAAVGQLYGRFPEKYLDKLLLTPVDISRDDSLYLKRVRESAKDYFRDPGRYHQAEKDVLGGE